MPKITIDVRALVRPNILNLTPYSSARSEFKGQADVLLDANESPFETGVNRYPDPLASTLRKRLGALKGIDPEQIMLGNGSDELVDYITRIFCRPGQDNIIALPPTFGMYKVAAELNDVEARMLPLGADFTFSPADVLAATDANTKVLWLCSPNNPSGNLIPTAQLELLLQDFPGIVVLDEAYIEYQPAESYLPQLANHPNLIVLQTLSKAWGLAGIRLGAAYASREIIHLMRAIKPPYNINILTQNYALQALEDVKGTQQRINFLVSERQNLEAALAGLPIVSQIFPSVTNFILVQFLNGEAVYQHLLNRGIVVRNQGKQPNCANCLRITVGTEAENLLLLEVLKAFKG